MEYAKLTEAGMKDLTEIEYYKNARSEVVQFLPDSYTKVLEIGCGEGYFRANLDSQCEYWGIEPVEPIARNAKDRLTKVLIGTFEDVCEEIPNEYFDLVICNDVIEHMPNHDYFLHAIKTKMKKGAYLIGSLPNIRYIGVLYELLFKKEWIYRDTGIMDRTHLRFFTYKSIERTFRYHGFDIETIEGVNSMMHIQLTIKKNVINVLMLLFLIVTFGYYSDTIYHQFGFRVKYSGE